MSEQDASRGVMFGGVFRRGRVETGDQAWLRSMLEVEAALARAVERAGLVPAGAGAAVTKAATTGGTCLAGSKTSDLTSLRDRSCHAAHQI